MAPLITPMTLLQQVVQEVEAQGAAPVVEEQQPLRTPRAVKVNLPGSGVVIPVFEDDGDSLPEMPPAPMFKISLDVCLNIPDVLSPLSDLASSDSDGGSLSSVEDLDDE
eukprot:TRINITY_DN71713_c0_g1_i1.p3 TRINITY_DN71713_c0_g1~~TRINITY_DN71713_c0_g1_i1.p3  ORF type:complete len:109 (+),score=38.57 TRINITY_DN71713_c0_g1_i1:97-423(+)